MGLSALFDTNILIDYLSGIPQAKKEIEKYSTRHISIITRMEVLVGVSEEETDAVNRFLNSFAEVVLDKDVAAGAVSLRQKYKIKLPDAIIWASAVHTGSLFVTRNSKDFPGSDPGVRIPYKIPGNLC